MKLVAFIVFAISMTCAHAVEVIVTGFGQSASEALGNAKELAVGEVAGTFIVGRNHTDGKRYDSSIEEHVGGYIKHYEVINAREEGRVHSITIRAEVDTDKANTRIEADGATVPSELKSKIVKSVDEFGRAKSIVAALDDRRQAYMVRTGEVTYYNRGELTDVEVELIISWQPKWIDDIRVMAKAIGREVDLGDPKADFMWGIYALSALISPALPATFGSIARAVENKPSISDEYAVCLGTNAWTDIQTCHEILHPLSRVTQSNHFNVVGRLLFPDHIIPLAPMGINAETYLFNHVRAGQQKYFSQGGYRTFSNSGVLLFREGEVRSIYRFSLPSRILVNIEQIEFTLS